MKVEFLPTTKLLKNRMEIAALLGKYGTADEMIDEIEHSTSAALAKIKQNSDSPLPTDLRQGLNDLGVAFNTLDRLLGHRRDDVRALFAGEAASMGVLQQFMALERAIELSHGAFALAAEAAARSVEIKRGKPPSPETAARRWLVSMIGNTCRRRGLEWSRASGDFPLLISLVWESIGFGQAADRDIRDAMEVWR